MYRGDYEGSMKPLRDKSAAGTDPAIGTRSRLSRPPFDSWSWVVAGFLTVPQSRTKPIFRTLRSSPLSSHSRSVTLIVDTSATVTVPSAAARAAIRA